MEFEYQRTLPAAAGEYIGETLRGDQQLNASQDELLLDPSSKFELLHPLGRGSYGSVYKARIIDTGEIVAIKMIPLTEPDEMESIQKEIAMLRDCNHPNIVKYYGSWRAPDALWIAMEYCAGGSVSDIMHALDSPLEESVISYICGEALAGLSYLHAQGRVHRDIKCGNILLTDDGEVKLADFGVAAQLTSTLSKRNTFIGTPHWMAPEVIQASHYDGKVDVWALGICSIEMAERYPPRWRVNPNRVIFMIVRDPPPRLAEKDAWTLSFQDFIAQCLTKDPRSRPNARYLQQHKFIMRDKTAALRSLLPLLHRATTEYAMIAAAAAATASSFAPTASDDGYFSWKRDPVNETLLVGGRPSSGGGIGSTISGTVVVHNSAADTVVRRDDIMSGTLVIKNTDTTTNNNTNNRAALYGQTVVASGGTTTTTTTTTRASGMHAEASADYLAAVHSAATESLDIDYYHNRDQQQYEEQYREGRGVSTTTSSPEYNNAISSSPYENQPQQRQQQYTHADSSIDNDITSNTTTTTTMNIKMAMMNKNNNNNNKIKGGNNEMQRMIERLYTIYSSGEVVPLPFISTTDMTPLALLQIDGGGVVNVDALKSVYNNREEERLSSGGSIDWRGALVDVYKESLIGDTTTSTINISSNNINMNATNANYNNTSSLQQYHALPAVLTSRVESSPVLMNMTIALARHKAAIVEQELHGVPQRKLESLKRKADALSDTLKTILCL